ncbi:MAG: family 2A encapsulin nanocompartment cargo protein cysteine desulfurase [Methyloceanibacter sp.]
MPEIPGSPGVTPLGLPDASALERVAASEGQAPDPAWIASIANSLFRGVGVDAFPGAGASLPSAPVYAVEPLIKSPDTPSSAPPVSPNLTVGATGAPAPGASLPSVPVHAPETLATADVPTAAQAAAQPSGEKGAAGTLPVSPSPPLPAAGPPAPPSGIPEFPSEADLAALPSTLGGAMSVIPPLDGTGPSYGGLGANLPSAPIHAPGAAVPVTVGVTPFPPRVTPPSVPTSPEGTSAPSVPLYTFEPLKFIGSPSVAGIVQPSGDKGGTSWPENAAAPYGADAVAGPGLGAGHPREAYYFLDEGLIAASQAKPLPYGWNGQSLNIEKLPAQHTPELALPPISGPRQFDAHIFRRDFPILHEYVNGKPLIWLDNAATTQKPQAVIDRISHFYEHENSNVHRAAHALAARSTDAFEAARGKVRRFINAPSDESVIWVRGTTEAINLVAQAWGRRNVGEGDEVVVTNLEHHSNIVPWQMLCTEKGAKLRVAPVDDRGDVLLDEYEKLLNPRTRIVAFTHVSNALGTVTPAYDMIEMAHRHGARVLVDGAQAVCHMPVDVQALGADFYVLSGHKMFGPTGVGVLYGKPEELETMPPWQGGGSMIEDVTFEKSIYQDPPEKFEAGTGTIADAVGLGAAIDYLERIGMANIAAYEHGLLDYALEGLRTIPGLTLIGTPRERAGAISFILDEWRVEDVGVALNREGIAVRAGHHCAQPILRRFGQESTVRPSFALYNTPEDVDALIAALHRLSVERGKRGF